MDLSVQKELNNKEIGQLVNQSKILELINRGNKCIYYERANEWKEFVEADWKGMYKSSIVEFVLEMMENIDNGKDFDEIIKTLDEHEEKNVQPNIWIKPKLLQFSKKGPELFTYYIKQKDKRNSRLAIAIYKRKMENRSFEQRENSNNNIQESKLLICEEKSKTSDENKLMVVNSNENGIISRIIDKLKNIFKLKK